MEEREFALALRLDVDRRLLSVGVFLFGDRVSDRPLFVCGVFVCCCCVCFVLSPVVVCGRAVLSRCSAAGRDAAPEKVEREVRGGEGLENLRGEERRATGTEGAEQVPDATSTGESLLTCAARLELRVEDA